MAGNPDNLTLEECEWAWQDYTCDSGLLLPMVNEHLWPKAGRATLYLIGLLWSFLAVAIIADIFMCSIEKITSKTATIKVANQESEKGYDEIEVKVWNDTVANLTLMALGSSAPEILLSCIEICFNNFKAGELGPSTIVGSAAFNLLVITAVCVVSIPSPETRIVKNVKVFATTAVFSVFAYVWLIIVLVANTANYIDIWEAVLTLLFFPILVILAYIAEKDFCGKKKVEADGSGMELGFVNKRDTVISSNRGSYNVSNGAEANKRGSNRGSYHLGNSTEEKALMAPEKMDSMKMRNFVRDLAKIHPDLSEEDIATLAAQKMQEEQPHHALWYRINGARRIGGAPRLQPTLSEHLEDVYEHLKTGEDMGSSTFLNQINDLSDNNAKAVIEFTASQASILENQGRVKIGVRRYGHVKSRIIFKAETLDGTAEANTDYIPIKDTFVMDHDETYKQIEIEIIDDNEWEPDEIFFVKLSCNPDDKDNGNVVVGKKSIMEITIVNDDEPGTFEFSKPSLLFRESAGRALIPIERTGGVDGRVTLKWTTEDMTAHTGKDFDGGEGTITFEHGESTKSLEIVIYDDHEAEKDESFKVILSEPNGGAKLGRLSKTIVTIVNDDEFNGMVSRLVDRANMNMDRLRVDSATYADQFRNAMNVNGGDLDGATHMDYLMHFLTFGFKVIFAICPPVSVAGGWLTFAIALSMIGLLTAVIGDLAAIFGCLVGLEPSVTAITFVALGTSLPDLFASKQAATQEKTADNSIGNVTGSNSVNVFLGLGLPWVIASIYHAARGDSFYVPAGTLAFSVLVYACVAIFCILLLVCRRLLPVFGKGELGGTFGPKIATGVILVCCWILYVLLSAFQAYNYFSVPF